MEEDLKTASEMMEHRKTMMEIKGWGDRDYGKKLDSFDKYMDFTKKFPSVSRHLIEFGDYSPAAFKLYVQRIQKNPINGQDDWCKAESYYTKYLTKALNPRMSNSSLRAKQREVYELLRKEYVDFKEKLAGAKAQSDKETAECLKQTKKDLYKIALADPDVMQRLRELYDAKADAKAESKAGGV